MNFQLLSSIAHVSRVADGRIAAGHSNVLKFSAGDCATQSKGACVIDALAEFKLIGAPLLHNDSSVATCRPS
jgi:hypothetical protein